MDSAAPEREKGSAIIVTVAAIAAMLLFASIVVDVGYVMLLRRTDQVAADTAVLAAVQDRYDEATFAATVLEMFNANVTEGGAFTLAELNTCGMSVPAGWSTYPSYNCLAHDGSYGEIRVQVPPREFQTTLGRLGGVNTITHTAFAQSSTGSVSDVLPFAIPAGAGDYECLKDGSKSNECTGSTNGNFGNVDFYTFGGGSDGTTKRCNGPKTMYSLNVAQGLDHDLEIWTGGTSVWEQTACNFGGAVPNGANSSTGNTPNFLAEGMWSDDTFPDGGPARLLRTSSLAPATSFTLDGAVVDDTPIWAYINPNLSNTSDVPRSCWRDQFVGDFDDTQPLSNANNMDKGGMDWPDDDGIMSDLPNVVSAYLIQFERSDRMVKLVERCLAHYQGQVWDDGGSFTGVDPHYNTCNGACDDPVFSRDSDTDDGMFDIQDSPRFAYVPQLPVGEALGNNNNVHFAAFRAVYLQRIYADNNATEVLDPGMASVGVTSYYSSSVAAPVTTTTTTTTSNGNGNGNGNGGGGNGNGNGNGGGGNGGGGNGGGGGGGNMSFVTSRGNQIRGMTAFVFPPGILPSGLADDDAATALGANRFLELTR
ncbi:MAG: hypothetical protein HKN03_15425 [Acidimicrobiales bacterium]|nr:hypothetical protein [Acidimicrobiales bacterium]